MITRLHSISECQLALNAIATAICRLNEANPVGEFRLLREWRGGKWSVAVRTTRGDRRSASRAKSALGARGLRKLGDSLAKVKGDQFDVRFNQQKSFRTFCVPLQNRLVALGVGRSLALPNKPDKLTFSEKLEEIRSVLSAAQLSSPASFRTSM